MNSNQEENTQPEPLVNLRDLAKMLGEPLPQVHHWFRYKGLPVHKVVNKWRFRLSEAKAWLEAQPSRYPEQLVDMQQLADRLGVSKKLVYYWLRYKGLPAYRLGNKWRFRASEAEVWRQNRQKYIPIDENIQWQTRLTNCTKEILNTMIENKKHKRFWYPSEFEHLGNQAMVRASIGILKRKGEILKSTLEIMDEVQTIIRLND